MNDAHNQCGQAYSLTVLTPILAGHEAALSRYLDRLGSGSDSPLTGVPGTHFARWVVMDDVVYEGPSQERDHLKFARLLFTSNFDGPFDPYLEGLRSGLGEAADEIWGHCLGYPGRAVQSAFANYMRAHQIGSALFFSAYGERTVAEVKRGLSVRGAVIDFALRAQGMGAAQLQAAFRESLGA